jgi:hypothetical protein
MSLVVGLTLGEITYIYALKLTRRRVQSTAHD